MLESDRILSLDPRTFLRWARAIARGVRADYGYGENSHEEKELEGVAYLALVELCERFDELRLPPEGNLEAAFRGWADKELRSRCRRAAVQLRNGGVFRTTNSAEVRRIIPGPLPTARSDDGTEEVVIEVQPEVIEEDEPTEPIACKHEPILVITNSKTGIVKTESVATETKRDNADSTRERPKMDASAKWKEYLRKLKSLK